tara:strand:- start:33 stop:215 length:183 start_codon:yes stop_codon:yes gene_type:complete
MAYKYRYIKSTFTGENCSIFKLDAETNEIVIAGIPFDEANTDYAEALEWVAKGNTIEEAD